MAHDPFDPVRGAWIILIMLIGAVIMQPVLVFAGCMLGAQAMCTRSGENLVEITGEVLVAVALLIGLGRKP